MRTFLLGMWLAIALIAANPATRLVAADASSAGRPVPLWARAAGVC